MSRYILITGCDSGFGNMLAKRLDSIGCNVFAACLKKEGAATLDESTSSRTITFIMDVTQQQDIENAYQLIKKALPNEKGLWGVVNNAGVLRMSLIDWMPMEHFKRIADVNLWGTIAVTKRFIPLVIQEQGRIVNINSVSGVIPIQFLSAYTVSKFGAEGFTGVLRREMRPFKVNVSTIKPSGFKSDITSAKYTSEYMKSTVSNLPQETLENYDDDTLKIEPQDFEKIRNQASAKLYLVINAIEDALLSTKPRADYYVGVSAQIIRFFSMLPSGVLDRIFQYVYPIAITPRRKNSCNKQSTSTQ